MGSESRWDGTSEGAFLGPPEEYWVRALQDAATRTLWSLRRAAQQRASYHGPRAFAGREAAKKVRAIDAILQARGEHKEGEVGA